MRNIALTVLAASLLTPALARAEPTPEELEVRAIALRDKLAGQGYTVLVEAPFVVVGDGPAAQVRRIAKGFLHDKASMLEKDFFDKRPERLLEVWLFQNERAFRKGAKKFFGDGPDTPYGYYSPTAHALIMNADGLGTLSHELVHPYMEINFPDVPSWFNEGFASLFEYPSERNGHIIGLVNWRLPELKKEIRAKTLPAMTKLMGTTTEEFYGADYDAYAFARYIMYYLQEHDQLHAFYTAFRADKEDLTGQAALESVLGEDLATFEPKWRAWVLQLKGG